MTIASINPATGETIAVFAEMSAADVEGALARAAEASCELRHTSFDQRRAWMMESVRLLAMEKEEVARTITEEMGKPIGAAREEVSKCVHCMTYYAEHAEQLLADESADAYAVGATRAFARYQPLGVVLGVMPWNFPFWQAVRFAAPALMAGNAGLLKHASNVPRTARRLGELFGRAGFPSGSFQTLLIEVEGVEHVLRDRRVAAVTLTGSEAAGAAVAAIAGSVIKPSVLELGGSDPFIVMPSAQVARAAVVGATARCQNSGQSCIAAKRFIVHDAVADEFEHEFVGAMSRLKVGDPMDEATEIGPLATHSALEAVEKLVADSRAQGANVLCGGRRREGSGWFYPPTVVSGVTPRMRLWREEVFGPVASVYRVGGIDEAVELANGTDFGLGASVWTEDRTERQRFVDDLEAGAVFVNGMVRSYPELPFGGVKHSGYGRELSAHGIRAFCNLKSVWVLDEADAGTF